MIKLSDYSTKSPKGTSKDSIRKKTKAICEKIAALQYIMMAEKKHSLLVVFQGMDSSGKDGATKNVFGECGPAGVNVHSFKKPTEEEFAHDFLWRVHKLAPEKGMISIFNRSHYEDILIQRVHNWIDAKKVNRRIAAINAFERNLVQDNNTTILKFYLHLSKERQAEKLQERIDIPRKQWKHNANDWKEREHWDTYMTCYEDAINRCNAIPWIIAPVDQRWYRNYFIAKKVLKTLEKMNPQFPVLKEK